MEIKHRLPLNIIPKNYDLIFEPNLKDFTFKGKETIKINLKESAEKIILHSKDLDIKKIFLDEKEIDTLNIKFNKDFEIMIINLPKKVSSGNHKLYIEFNGILNEDLLGFYRSKYFDEKGNEKYIATTQFEAPYARKAFPCFDEPSFKATFNVSLIIDQNLKAISNMPEVSSKTYEEDLSKKILKFEKTPPMSIYLLYLGVGDFEWVEDKYKDVLIRVITLPKKSSKGHFALDVAKKCLEYFENYSKVDYPLPKLDMLAIPDFAAGAMENWGAITYREILLLFDEEKTSIRVKKRIAEVIAHEIWHQWSGNLVTMQWWDDLWLNESFATYMAYKVIHHWFPKWDMWDDFLEAETSRAFSEDALKTTHPIAVKVNSANEIEEIFDAISYSKGGSVLRMIDSFLGEEIFREGVSKYLKKYSYKNAKAENLWEELEKSSKNPHIKKLMENWINTSGYPLVSVEEKDGNLSLFQERFRYLFDDEVKKENWKIPLVIQTKKDLKKDLLNEENKIISLEEGLIKLNFGQEGFYKVNYSKDHLEKLRPLIEDKSLSKIDRWGIHRDLFDLTLAGRINLDTYFDFLKFYKNEDSFLVLSDIFSSLHKINHRFKDFNELKEIWPKFYNVIKQPFEESFNKLSWNPSKEDSEEDKLLRSLNLDYFSLIGDENVIKEATKKLKDSLNNSKDLHPDIKGIIYVIVAKKGDREIFNLIKNAYLNSKDPEEKQKLLGALYRFEDKSLLKEALDFALTKDVRRQDLRGVFLSSSINPLSKEVFFPWIKENWGEIEKLSSAHYVVIGLIEAIILPHTGEEKKKEILEFLESKKVKYEKTKKNAFEFLDINTIWIKRNKEILKDYFNNLN